MATHDEAANPIDYPSAARTESGVQPLNRRRALRMLGVLATAAAGAAALSATRPEEASAATSGTLWYTSSTTSSPFGTIEGDNTGGGDGVYGSSASGNGMEGTTAAGRTGSNGPAGVVGWTNASNGAGVLGQANSSSSYGVWGQAGPGGIGVFGDNSSSGIGVEGFSASHIGVYGSGAAYGVYGNGSLGGSIGVYGSSISASNSVPGVYGVNTGGGPAIVGQATGSGFGFSAITVSGTGCFGGASSSGTGVYAYSVGGPALVAFAAGGSNLAGYFSGPLYITGSLTVLGAKSAAVKAADGKLRRMYSLESPESWFEDFGSGQLSGGSATVQLEPGFAGVVHGDNYRVFLTPRGESKGWLYIGKQTPGGFTVQEAGGGTSNIAFDYRVVAKRKDIVGARLEHVDEPPTLEVPAFPTLPAVEPPPVAPRGHGTDR